MFGDGSLYWPAEFSQKKSRNDEVTNVDVSCHVTLGTQNQVDCLKAAHNFKELYAQAVVLNPEAPPRSSISGMGSLSSTPRVRVDECAH